MTFHGQPSLGCQICRQRKIKVRIVAAQKCRESSTMELYIRKRGLVGRTANAALPPSATVECQDARNVRKLVGLALGIETSMICCFMMRAKRLRRKPRHWLVENLAMTSLLLKTLIVERRKTRVAHQSLRQKSCQWRVGAGDSISQMQNHARLCPKLLCLRI